MPIWVEEKLNEVIIKYSNNTSPSSFSSLRKELSELGLERMFPYSLQSVLENNND
jgi:hypothetical protein